MRRIWSLSVTSSTASFFSASLPSAAELFSKPLQIPRVWSSRASWLSMPPPSSESSCEAAARAVICLPAGES